MWFPFTHQVEVMLACLGLSILIEGPKAQESEARKDWIFSFISYTKYDALFFCALSEAICHKESKQPRDDLVNSVCWYPRPYCGSSLWERCTALMDSPHIVEDRKQFYENQLTGVLLEQNERIHPDALVFNTAAAKLSYRALVMREKDGK